MSRPGWTPSVVPTIQHVTRDLSGRGVEQRRPMVVRTLSPNPCAHYRSVTALLSSLSKGGSTFRPLSMGIGRCRMEAGPMA